MSVVRPISQEDLPALYELARLSGSGFTSLPTDMDLLQQKIIQSEEAFARQITVAGPETYLMVLQDDQDTVVGCCAVTAAVGLDSPWYHYRIGTEVHECRELGVRNSFQTLFLCNDYTGCSELCTLFLKPEYRQKQAGLLLSKSRFLLMFSQPERFSERVIAELRGVMDEQQHSPFWDGLGRRFFSIDFAKADHLTGIGQKTFIAQLMPKHSIYIHLLPESAQAVIGQVHQNTRAAQKILLREGFRYENYVDIFDAGPTVSANRADIHTIKASRKGVLTIDQSSLLRQPCLLSSCPPKPFRATLAEVAISDDNIGLSKETAQWLGLSEGDHLCYCAL